ncbi:DegT/DnrJ/EryC1/StrS family aminotransferase [candidate division KSB1 bacterium]|nr:DegT/DnrJ/EryC1/StrS family aminotransferase [candidate division KSB1 bacterium]
MAFLAIRGGEPVRTESFPVWPVWGDEEIANLTQVIKSGQWGRLKGTVTADFERRFAELQGARYGICLNSGTTALQIALVAADVMPGTEVICPAYTFIATASAIVDVGCIPVFVDVDPNTFNIDPEKIRQAITDRTSAIMPVHFAGRPFDVDAVLQIARDHGLKVIEDAAQAWGASWNGKPVGALGDAGCFSFQSSKNINCGEGGIILTNDEMVAKFAQAHHNCGRSQDGQWYEHFYYGGNYRMTELQAAVLHAQLDRYPELHRIRLENLAYLQQGLAEIDGIELCSDDARITRHACHLYAFRYLKSHFSGAAKSVFIEALRKEGIPASPGYSLPLYAQPVFRQKSFGPRGKKVHLDIDYTTCHCPVTEDLCYEQAVWFTQNMLLGTQEDMDDIIEAVVKISEHADEIAV